MSEITNSIGFDGVDNKVNSLLFLEKFDQLAPVGHCGAITKAG